MMKVKLRKRKEEFMKRYPRYNNFLLKHPWIPGVYLIIVGIAFILFWYYGFGKDSEGFIIRNTYKVLHLIGAVIVIYGASIVIRESRK